MNRVVIAPLLILLTGCVTSTRYAPIPLESAAIGSGDNVLMCSLDNRLLVVRSAEIRSGEICGEFGQNEYRRDESGLVERTYEQKCIPNNSVSHILEPRQVKVGAASPLVGPSCGDDANEPLQVYSDGTVRWSDGSIVGETSPKETFPNVPDNFPSILE